MAIDEAKEGGRGPPTDEALEDLSDFGSDNDAREHDRTVAAKIIARLMPGGDSIYCRDA